MKGKKAYLKSKQKNTYGRIIDLTNVRYMKGSHKNRKKGLSNLMSDLARLAFNT